MRSHPKGHAVRRVSAGKGRDSVCGLFLPVGAPLLTPLTTGARLLHRQSPAVFT